MSKSVTSNSGARWSFSVASWQLAQTFWVGGLWLLHFVMLPALNQIGFASLLIEEVSWVLRPLLVSFAGFCGLTQILILTHMRGFSALWRELRGQLLLAVLGLVVAFFALREILQEPDYAMMFSYLLLAFVGAWLVIQPVPRRVE